MMTTDTEAPELVYRGLDRCDLRGEALAPGEQRAGIRPACRWPEVPRSQPGTARPSTSTRHKTAHKLP